ncbi:hypothetical protein GOV03_01110 [Candidatus Woesearchaeota archaeon]|nr:hypothetical protein [Candidatus Woesearchaeota archaeon]
MMGEQSELTELVQEQLAAAFKSKDHETIKQAIARHPLEKFIPKTILDQYLPETILSVAHGLDLDFSIAACSACKEYRVNDIWFSPSEELLTRLQNYQETSHGLCDPCAKKLYGYEKK